MTQYYQGTLNRILRQSILKLCSENIPYSQELEIDGIICITNGDESRPLVVKVHEVVGQNIQNGMDEYVTSPDDTFEGSSPPKKRSLYSPKAKAVTPVTSSWGRKRKKNQRKNSNVIKVVSDGGPYKMTVDEEQANDLKQTSKNDDNSRGPNSTASLQCGTCFKALPNREDLITHNMEEHRRFTCEECFATFTMHCNLKRHQKLHRGGKSFQCFKCDKSFSRNDDLKLHLTKHSPINGMTHASHDAQRENKSCPQCKTTFVSAELYDSHKCQDTRLQEGSTSDSDGNSHGIGDGVLIIKDEPIDLTVVSSSQTGNDCSNNNQAEVADKKAVCSPENIKSLLKDVLTSNANVYNNRRENLASSPLLNGGSLTICETTKLEERSGSPIFPGMTDDVTPLKIPVVVASKRADSPRTTSPTSHIESRGASPASSRHHSPSPRARQDARPGAIKIAASDLSFYEEQEATCNICKESFSHFAAFDDHCEHAHYTFPCRVCKQTFTNRNNRQRHERSHMGTKCYFCPDCSKGFTRSDILREHRITHTTSYSEGKCGQCGLELTKKADLLNHIKKCAKVNGIKLETIVSSPISAKSEPY